MTDTSHDFSGKYDAWELRVFDSATSFSCVTVYGGGRRDRAVFSDLPSAFNAARDMQRTCVYAVSGFGHGICLDRKLWDVWLERWNENQLSKKITPRPVKRRRREALAST
jgi:hypothetical protein